MITSRFDRPTFSIGLPCLFSTFYGLAVAFGSVRTAGAAQVPADWRRERFQLGHWTCTAKAGTRTLTYAADFSLQYGGSVLRARITNTGRDGKVHVADFNTVRPDAKTYAGVWIADDGAIGTWTNAGWTGNRFTEIGYTLVGGKLTNETHFVFTKLSDTLYTYDDYRNGAVFEHDRCVKT